MSSSSTPSIAGYDHLSLIGAGAFSQVYLAEQSKLKRRVAIKVLNFGLDDDTKRRSFERETELMARVSMHPNIATIHDTAFTELGQPCIVMGHYAAGSLADLTARVGTLSVKEAIDVGIAIGSALNASHDAGVVHCDIKPHNVLISAYGQPALGDFGISTFTDERTQTGDGARGFTLSYAAPEILEGESPSPATDIYSLAATLYAALAGHRPFARSDEEAASVTMAERARRVVLDELAPLAGVPAELDAAIRTAMDRDPDRRPESAAIFAAQLYDIGQELGLATSIPYTSDRTALSASSGPGARHPKKMAAGQDQGVADAAIDPTRLLIKRLDSVAVAPPRIESAAPFESPSSEQLPVRAEGSAPTVTRSKNTARGVLVFAVLLSAVIGTLLFLQRGIDSVIAGPSSVEAGTSAVYTVPDASSGSVRWVDVNGEIVIRDTLELTGVIPGVVSFSAITNGETYTREVTVESSPLGPTIEGPSLLRVGEVGTYSAATPDDGTLTWMTDDGVSGAGSTFTISQTGAGTIVQVVATDASGVARGDQLRVEVDT